ncbi:MAG: MMPL family transporter [Deltaproteobacteria bacterium]|nr:MMPL family transporter [Deltaproteobacteria bacterium]
MIKRIIEFYWRFRYVCILLMVVLVTTSVVCIKDLVVEGDILEYMPPEHKDVRLFKEIGNKYLSNYFIMLSIEAAVDNGVFEKDYLKSIAKLTKALRDIEGVSSVISITNIMDIKKIEDGIEVSSLIEEEEIERMSDFDILQLKEYVLNNERYVNHIVSSNGRYSQIIIRPSQGSDRAKVVNMVEEVCNNLLKDTGLKFYAGGWPVAIRDTNNATMGDLKKLTPIVIIISMIVLFLGFRTVRGVVLPIFVVIVANLFTFAIMALLKKPVTLGTSAIPVILVSTGTAYAIHIINQYYFHASKSLSKGEVILHAITDKWKAVFLSALTTMAGFVTLMTATLTTVVDLGFFMTLGIFLSFLLAIFIVPLILYMLPIKQARKVLSEEEALSYTHGIFLPIAEKFVLFHSKKVILGFGVLTIILIPTLFNLTADVNPINYFKEDAAIRKSEQLLVDHFGGAVPVFVLVKGDVKDPRVMYFTEYVEREVEAIENIGSAQSVASIIADLNYNLINYYNIPDTAGKIGNLWFFVEGNEYLNQYVTQEMDESIVLARIESLQKSQVTYANRAMRELLSKIPSEYKIVDKRELSIGERNGVIEYQKSHILKRIQTELSIARVKVDEKVVKDLVEKVVMLGKVEGGSLPYELCLQFHNELKSRIKKIRSDFGIDVILEEQDGDEMCALDVLNRLSLVSEKVLLEDDEVEEQLKTEWNEFKDSMKSYHSSLYLKHLVNSTFSSYGIKSSSLKHMEGLLGLLLNDNIIIGSDYEGFSSLRDESLKIVTEYGGLGPILAMLDENLMKNQITSIIIALLLVFVLMFYLTRSFLIGLVSMIPICFTLLVDFSIMSIFGIAIDDVTIVIASILIGVGIDYTIHIITGLKLGYEKYSDDDKAISFAIRVIGRAVFLNTFAVALGFIALLFGDFLPLRSMGILTAVTMFIAAFSAVILIPSFVKSYKKFNIKEVKL